MKINTLKLYLSILAIIISATISVQAFQEVDTRRFQPKILSFRIKEKKNKDGVTVNFFWKVENAIRVKLYENGKAHMRGDRLVDFPLVMNGGFSILNLKRRITFQVVAENRRGIAKSRKITVNGLPEAQEGISISNFKADNLSDSELLITVDYSYTGDLESKDIFINAFPMMNDGKANFKDVSVEKSPIKAGNHQANMKISKRPGGKDFRSESIKVCVIAIRSSILCEEFPFAKSWVDIENPAKINSFLSSENQVQKGDSVTLTWETENTSKVMLGKFGTADFYEVPFSYSIERKRTHNKSLRGIKSIKYLGDYPKNRQNNWGEKLQGIAHNYNNWFFTQTKTLWKFPLSHDLNKYINHSNLPTGVKKTGIPDELKKQNYDHFGDLVEHKGYLFIPLEGSAVFEFKLQGKIWKKAKVRDAPPPLLAVFRASDLSFIGSAPLTKQTKAGWVAINYQDGLLYTSHNKLNPDNKLLVYKVDYKALSQGSVSISDNGTKTLFDENGKIVKLRPYMQGGEFSTDSKYLFLLNGKTNKISNDSGGQGIWVFDFESGRKIRKSSQKGDFKYEFHPGTPKYEEPEGFTYWNLDGKKAPNVRGNLHAILLNALPANKDNFYLKHYRVEYYLPEKQEDNEKVANP